jgi:hypothetical protein
MSLKEFFPGRLPFALRDRLDPVLSKDVPDRGVGRLIRFPAGGTASRGLGFALPEDDVTSCREEGDDDGDAGTPEPPIRPPP